ncbi:hypothetical protein GCM10027446_01360 [Angustibacter peucedani]
MADPFPTHDRLSLIPDARVAAGPRVCLASLGDAQRGILTAEWFVLRGPLEHLALGAACLQARAVTGPAGPLGIFDFEDVPADVVQAKPSLAYLHETAHRRGRH